jgi:hypothetical protein
MLLLTSYVKLDFDARNRVFWAEQHTIWTNNLAQIAGLINIFGKTRFLSAFSSNPHNV